MRDAILEGLLGCDVVGFQSSLDVRNFLLTCEENAGPAGGRARAGGLLRRPRRLCAPLPDLDRRLDHVAARRLARRQAAGARPGIVAPAAPDRAHRPDGSLEEHRSRLHRLRQAAALSPRAARPGAVLGLPAAVAPGRRRLQPLPAADPADRRPHQQRVRHRDLAAGPARDRRERAQGGRLAQELRRAAGQPGLRRAEPRGQGRRARQRDQRRDRAVRERRRPRRAA